MINFNIFDIYQPYSEDAGGNAFTLVFQSVQV